MSHSVENPVLIIGGSGVVGSQMAEMLRRFHPDLPITIAGRNLDNARDVASRLGNADAIGVDLTRRDLGLPSDHLFSAVVPFLKDASLNSLHFAQARGIPYVSISSGVYEVGPEMALHIHRPNAAPVLLASNWLAGAATLPALHFAKDFKKIDDISIAAVLDEQDMGGPAAAADYERLTTAAPSPLIRVNGEWVWISGEDAQREVKDIDGQIVTADAYSPMDVLGLAAVTDVPFIRFDLVYGISASRRAGKPFSTAIIIEITGEKHGGEAGTFRYELEHDKGQAPLTAFSVVLALEALLGLTGNAPVKPGLYMPENLIEPEAYLGRMQEIGTSLNFVGR